MAPVSRRQKIRILRGVRPASCIFDPYPSPLIKAARTGLLDWLGPLINSSLRTILKEGVMQPRLKKLPLDPRELNNYGPVSTIRGGWRFPSLPWPHNYWVSQAKLVIQIHFNLVDGNCPGHLGWMTSKDLDRAVHPVTPPPCVHGFRYYRPQYPSGASDRVRNRFGRIRVILVLLFPLGWIPVSDNGKQLLLHLDLWGSTRVHFISHALFNIYIKTAGWGCQRFVSWWWHKT